MDRQIDVDADGQPITVADRILNAVKVGTPLAGAASCVGITVVTLHQWMRDGARIERTLYANPDAELTDYDRRAAAFSYEIAHAIGEWEYRANEILEGLAVGGTEIVTITQKVRKKDDGTEEVLETSRKTEKLGPNPEVIKWRLRTRFPDRYAERVEVSGPGGEPIPIESRARLLVEQVVAFKAAQEQEAIEVESSAR